MERIGVHMHGVRICLESDNPKLMEYASEHLQGLVETPGENCDLLVRCYWHEGNWNPESHMFHSNTEMDTVGKRMLGQADELIWMNTLRMPGLQLRFSRKQRQWNFEVAYYFHLKKEKLARLPEYRYKRYFSLMSYLIYYPLFWYLERTRGWTILHASALATDKGGIIIGGLGGVGKTTTCVGLMQRDGINLISENLVFTDGEFVYPCYEPIRLDERSLTLLDDRPEGLSQMVFPEGLKKKHLFHFTLNGSHQLVRPEVLLLPYFSQERKMTAVEPDVAAEKMAAINRLTREIDDYIWYSSALDMKWPQPGSGGERAEALRRFAQRTRCFEMGIDRSRRAQVAVEDILQLLGQ